MSVFQSLAREMGLQPLNFTIDEYSRGKIMRVSILPFVVFSAILTKLALDLVFGSDSGVNLTGSSDIPEIWSRLYRVAVGTVYLEWAALGVLFLGGISKWNRNEGAWMLVLGTFLAITSALFAAYFAIGLVLIDSYETYEDFRVTAFAQAASGLGLMSIGYFFLAYRGLRPEPPRRRLRRGRRRQPPPAPAPLEG